MTSIEARKETRTELPSKTFVYSCTGAHYWIPESVETILFTIVQEIITQVFYGVTSKGTAKWINLTDLSSICLVGMNIVIHI